MTSDRATIRSSSRPGFTLIELLVVMVLGGVLLTAVMKLMLSQAQSYGKQLEVMDAREATRTAAAVLEWELRHAGAGGSTLAMISADSLRLRTVTGLGVICGRDAVLPRYGLWRTAGNAGATTADSALVFQLGTDSTWRVLKISQVGTPAALGVPACAWSGGRVPDLVVEFVVNSKRDTSTIKVGAPVSVYEHATYAETQSGGRWYLGRQISGGAGWEQIAGPLSAPGLNGLKFTYYDKTTAVTANPANVASVGVTVIAQSTKFIPGTTSYEVDTVTTKVSLRR